MLVLSRRETVSEMRLELSLVAHLAMAMLGGSCETMIVRACALDILATRMSRCTEEKDAAVAKHLLEDLH